MLRLGLYSIVCKGSKKLYTVINTRGTCILFPFSRETFHQSSFHSTSLHSTNFLFQFCISVFISIFFHSCFVSPVWSPTSGKSHLSSTRLVKLSVDKSYILSYLHKQCALSFKHCSFVWLAIAPQCTLYSLVPRPSSLITCSTL